MPCELIFCDSLHIKHVTEKYMDRKTLARVQGDVEGRLSLSITVDVYEGHYHVIFIAMLYVRYTLELERCCMTYVLIFYHQATRG